MAPIGYAAVTNSREGWRRAVASISLTWPMRKNGVYRIDGTDGPKDLGPVIQWVLIKFEQRLAAFLKTIHDTETDRSNECPIARAAKRIAIVPEASWRKRGTKFKAGRRALTETNRQLDVATT